MSHRRRAKAEDQAVREHFREQLSCLRLRYPDHGAAYLSFPISSGRRLFRALHTFGLGGNTGPDALPEHMLMKQVIGPNIAAARGLIQSRSWDEPVIDPTSVIVTGARQEEYRAFWAVVLREKASRLVACLDWPFSFGSLSEIRLAMSLPIPVSEVGKGTLQVEDVLRLIASADDELEHAGCSGRPMTTYWRSCHA